MIIQRQMIVIGRYTVILKITIHVLPIHTAYTKKGLQNTQPSKQNKEWRLQLETLSHYSLLSRRGVFSLAFLAAHVNC